jgi:hypothetical protein
MQVVRGEMAKAQARQQKQESSSAPSHQSLHPRPQWMKDEHPFVSDDEANRDWQEGTQLLFGPAIPPGPSSFTGGNTIKATVEVHHPVHGKSQQKVALDTQSDVTTCLREYLSDVHPVLPDTVSGIAGEVVFSEEGTLNVFSAAQRRRVALPTLVAPRHQIPFGCIALLGVPALQQLEVAVEQHLKLPHFSPLICHLGEKKLREWLEHHPDKAVDTSPFDLSQIQINPALKPEEISRVKEVIRKYARVFEGHENSLPKPFATDESIILKMNEGKC